MRKALIMVAILFANLLVRGANGESQSLPRSEPEAQGISSSAILAFIEAADKDIASMHSFMLVRHGYVVTEGWWTPYNPASRHELYSLSKSFTSTAVGFAVAEGKLSVDDELTKLFPDDLPAEPSNQLKAMRIRDLLRMATGHESEPKLTPDVPWKKTFLAHPVPFKPGSHFLYNTPATYMLSAAVQQKTGQTVLEYLTPRLFEPLGIENPTWGKSPEGISLGGYGLSVRTEDIAKFGELYLRQGKWNGKQILPSNWISEATARQISNGSNPQSDWDQGYGYQFWRCRTGGFRGDGAFGQYCIVLPEQDAVIAITSAVRDMQAVLNLVWGKLLPELGNRPLDANRASCDRLRTKLSSLVIPTPAGAPESKLVDNFAGRTYQFPSNESKVERIAIEKGNANSTLLLKLTVDGKEQQVSCGHQKWIDGRGTFSSFAEQPIAASGAWESDETFVAKLCFYETPFCLTLNLKFSGDELVVASESNVGFNRTKPEPIRGLSLRR